MGSFLSPTPFRLIHYAEEKFDFDFNKSYNNKKRLVGKPRGLYLSVDDAWLRWCVGVEHMVGLYQWEYEFELLKTSKILIIQTCDELKKFLETFVSWEVVGKEYDGVGFLNYDEVKRRCFLSMPMWFYALDVSCYVIWNCEILKKLNCKPCNFSENFKNTNK